MVVKFFANKKGGSVASVNYLLNEREAQGTARTLKGDAELTKELIKGISNKQKATVGCLSFEEKNIPELKKFELMREFEETLLPGLENRYNILWVEHVDKGRLELNFVIPKIDLVNNKSINPYYHKADLPRVEKWQDLINIENDYSNPKDPIKARTLEINSKEKHLAKDYEQLDKLLHSKVHEGVITNREQIIELLKDNNIEVTRKHKEHLSIKLPNSKRAKKFKGAIYNEQFRSIGELGKQLEEQRDQYYEWHHQRIRAKHSGLRQELNEYTQVKFAKNRETAERRDKLQQKVFNNVNSTIDNNGYSSPSLSDNGNRNANRWGESNIYNNRGLEDDRIRNNAERRTRDSEVEERETIQELTRTRERLQEQFTTNCKRTHGKFKINAESLDRDFNQHVERTREKQYSNINTARRIREGTRTVKELIQAKKEKREQRYTPRQKTRQSYSMSR